MRENNLKNLDILDNIDLSSINTQKNSESNDTIKELNIDEIINESINNEEIKNLDVSDEIRILEEKTISDDVLSQIDLNENKTKPLKRNAFVSGTIFLTKYILTSTFIFAILLVSTNYSAYLSVAKSYFNQEELQQTQKKLISSVEASSIKEKYAEEKIKEIKEDEEQEDTLLSIKRMKKEQDKEDINLNIEITPYENRVVIPKIGKNIPLIDIKNRNIEGEKELNNIFMKELENGIIRYPGSAKPGEDGTSFIFGHSSNFPWINGDYNDVFALLDKVVYNDEVIVYYGQKKYIYKIREKKIITPGDVSVLERNKKKSEITLMTCWPIGTTLNRLIVTGELVEEK